MKAKKLRKHSQDQLAEELLKLRREEFNLRMQRASGQLTRTDQFGKVRKNIARIKTIMNEKAESES